MENNPSREDVRLWGQFVFVGLQDDVGREVARSAAFVCSVIFLPGIDGEAEIDDNRLQRESIPHHNVLQLYVPVDHLLVVQLNQSLQDPAHDCPCFFNRKLSPAGLQKLE